MLTCLGRPDDAVGVLESIDRSKLDSGAEFALFEALGPAYAFSGRLVLRLMLHKRPLTRPASGPMRNQPP